ncbi:unnamed protein product [Toxocara canis]|uniref:Ig-like domain-containing protein n=1 Tax=Toxocara canis TaxID=6265 RepID=A0A183UX29_TOXCA|nr:unnamed protein product [Toxocara canis]
MISSTSLRCEHAIRLGHSTSSVLIKVAAKICETVEGQSVAAAVQLDVTRPYDGSDRKVSLKSLENRTAHHSPVPVACNRAEVERIRWYPKDGELCLSRMKPEETLVEVRSGSDVQIDRLTWV